MVTLLVFLAVLYAGICFLMYRFQESFLFHPNPFPENAKIGAIPGMEVEEVFWENGDARLHGLIFRVRDPKGGVLYFHGNAGNVIDWMEVARRFVIRGYEVVLPDYRGYGKSTGKRSQENLYTDAAHQYEYARERYGQENLIVYGRSMGSGMATFVASKNSPSRLILETPYYSIHHVSSEKFAWLPVGKLLRYPFPSYDYLPKVTCPVNLIHGTRDGVIPYSHSHRLLELLPETQIDYLEIEGGTHNDLETFEEYHRLLDELLGEA